MTIVTSDTELVAALETAGIDAKTMTDAQRGYSAADEAFLISVDAAKNRILVNRGPAKATVEVHPDGKEFTQAVVNVTEPARDLVRRVRLAEDQIGRKLVPNPHPDDLRNLFPVTMVAGTTYHLGRVDKEPVQERRKKGQPMRYHRFATITATAPPTTQSFLVGIDEAANFIAQLPKKATSVARAHTLLRPKGVPATAPRQGEWFFVPATAAERKLCEAELLGGRVKAVALEIVEVRRGYNRNLTSDHFAQQCVEVMGIKFVTGIVRDRRTRRASGVAETLRHAPLVLNGWHKVVRNAEVVQKATPARGATSATAGARAQAWQYRRTYD